MSSVSAHRDDRPLTPAELLGGEPDLVDPKTGYRVWWVDPIGFVSETALDSGVLCDACADFICDVVKPMMEARSVGTKGFYIAHDWGRVTSYTDYARKRLIDYMLKRSKLTAGCGLVLSRSSPFARAGAMTAAAAIRMVGYQIRFGADVSEMCGFWNLKRAR